MKIKSIKFVRPFLGRRRITVELSNGKTYRIKRSGGYAVVLPPCNEGEREALGDVYHAAWEWLNGGEPEYLDRGAKVACGRLVSILDWPSDFTDDIEARLHYVVDKITNSENIF